MTQHLLLVLQLQNDALSGAEIPISTLLRKARVVASKLQVKDTTDWIEKELNGHTNERAEELPEYRKIYGQVKGFNPFHGWIPLMLPNQDWSNSASLAPLFQSAGVLEELVRSSKKGNLQYLYPDNQKALLMKMFGHQGEISVFFSHAAVWAIVDHIRSLVLDWTLSLEAAGVLGEGMTFTQPEKEKGNMVTNNYFHAQNIGVAGNVNDQAHVIYNQTSASEGFDFEGVKNLLLQIKHIEQGIPNQLSAEISDAALRINRELEATQPSAGKIKQLLISLRTTCEGAAGSLIASGIIEAIKRIVAP